MRHSSLPQNMTAERLGQHIDMNKVDTKHHIDKINYTEEEIREFEHQSSSASRAIDKLEVVMGEVKELIKKGTEWDHKHEVFRPVNVTIPASKGTDALRKNRAFADAQIERGYREDVTKLFILPDPESLKMICVDITGEEWPQYSRDMDKNEVRQYGKPLLVGDSAKGLEVKMEGRTERGQTILKVEKTDTTSLLPELDLKDEPKEDGEPEQEAPELDI